MNSSFRAASGDYVRRGGLDVIPGPWRSDDVELHAFYLQADMVALQKLCDRQINRPTQGALHYQPNTNHVLLTFQHLRDLRSIAPGYENSGAHSYCEASFWVITSARDAAGKTVSGPTLMIPYIFSGNAFAVSAGRELYGYPKEFAVVRMPRADAPDEDYSVEALAVPRFDADARAEVREIVRVRRVDDSLAAGLAHAARSVGDDLLSTLLQGRVEGSSLALMRDFIGMLLRKRIEMVYLRQLRANTPAPLCDYQTVVSAAHDPLQLKSVQALQGRYELTLPSLASHPIAEDLGLTLIDGIVRIAIGAKINLSFVLTPGRVLWPAPQS